MPPHILLFIGLLGLCISLPANSLEIGDDAPQIFGRDISGNLFTLNRMPAKPKVINFFWVNCGPCREEIPLLAAEEKAYPKVAFAVVHAEKNTDTDTNYDISEIKAFAETLDAHPKTIVLGSEQLKVQYHIEGFPMSYLLSADNKVEGVLFGFTKNTVKQLTLWLKKQQ